MPLDLITFRICDKGKQVFPTGNPDLKDKKRIQENRIRCLGELTYLVIAMKTELMISLQFEKKGNIL